MPVLRLWKDTREVCLGWFLNVGFWFALRHCFSTGLLFTSFLGDILFDYIDISQVKHGETVGPGSLVIVVIWNLIHCFCLGELTVLFVFGFVSILELVC